MKGIPFKESVESHFEPLALPDKDLERLLELQRSHEQIIRKPASSSLMRLKPVLALCLSILLVCSVLFPFIGTKSILPSIADEVAKNHVKLKPLEVKSKQKSDIERFFNRLNFTPIDSEVFTLPMDQLVGARYCSIQGEIASQLRYHNEKHQPVTLYQAVLPMVKMAHIPNVDLNERPAVFNARGVRVRIWLEKGLVMASVNESI